MQFAVIENWQLLDPYERIVFCVWNIHVKRDYFNVRYFGVFVHKVYAGRRLYSLYYYCIVLSLNCEIVVCEHCVRSWLCSIAFMHCITMCSISDSFATLVRLSGVISVKVWSQLACLIWRMRTDGTMELADLPSRYRNRRQYSFISYIISSGFAMAPPSVAQRRRTK